MWGRSIFSINLIIDMKDKKLIFTYWPCDLDIFLIKFSFWIKTIFILEIKEIKSKYKRKFY